MTRSGKRRRKTDSGENHQNTVKKPNESTQDMTEENMADSSLITVIKSTIDSALLPIKTELQQVAKSSELKDLREDIDRILHRQDELEGRIRRVEGKLDDIEKTPLPPTPAVSNAINSLEQYTRRNSLRIRGIPEVEGERSEFCIQKVVNFCRIKLGIDIPQQSIDRAHRVGVRSGNTSRTMLVKFISWQDRNKVFRARTKLKGKRDDEGKPLLVTADLTRENMRTFSAALSAKKRNLIKDVWIDANCRIMITALDKSTKNIECIDDLPSGSEDK
ncbi:hypothetical protein Bbelb_163730 [Branchiostoma belcheri]|nr:hypothetical protein Bbelb_163730 [Branchiostoma belcheri]